MYCAGVEGQQQLPFRGLPDGQPTLPVCFALPDKRFLDLSTGPGITHTINPIQLPSRSILPVDPGSYLLPPPPFTARTITRPPSVAPYLGCEA